jgi:hypothetical protein
LSAILFLYQILLKHEIGWLNEVVRAKKPRKLPVALTHEGAKIACSATDLHKYQIVQLFKIIFSDLQ